MEIAIQSSDELEQLRTRLRKMTDAQLIGFGKAARSLCRDPKCPDTFKRQFVYRPASSWRAREESTIIGIPSVFRRPVASKGLVLKAEMCAD